MVRLAARCRSSISTNSVAISAIALIASGTMIEAPSAVIVPDTLMIGRSPRRSRIGRLLSLFTLADISGILA